MKNLNSNPKTNDINNLNKGLGPKETVMKSITLNLVVAAMAIFTLNFNVACTDASDPAEVFTDMSITVVCGNLADGEICPELDVSIKCLVPRMNEDGSDGFYELTRTTVDNTVPFGTKHDDAESLPSESCDITLDLPEGFETDGQINAVEMPDSAPINHEVAIKKPDTIIIDPPLEIDLTTDNSAELTLEAKATDLNDLVGSEFDAMVCDYAYDENGINSLRTELPLLEAAAFNAGVDHENRANLAVSEEYVGCGENEDEVCTEESDEIINLLLVAADHFAAVNVSAMAEVNASTNLANMLNRQVICDMPDVVVNDPSTITPELLDVGGWVEDQAETVHISVARNGAFVGTLCEIAAGDSRVCDSIEVDSNLSYNLFVHFGPADPANWDVLFSVEVISLDGADLSVQIPVYEPAP